MKKLVLIFGFLLATVPAIHAQIVQMNVQASGAPSSDVKQKELDKAYMECIYDMTFLRDTADTEKTGNDVMKLLVGPRYSKFFSHKTARADSLLQAEIVPGQSVNISSGSKYERGETYTIYKDREKEQLVFTDKIFMDMFRYEEKLEAQDWEILGETREIQGYECQKAVCSFRGRDYTAWFTTEIPINEGPWKFGGLPGLIMAVADNEGHYSFELTGISRVDDLPVEYPEHQYHKSKRKEYLKTLEKYKSDPIGYLQNNSGANVQVEVRTPDGSTPPPLNFMNYEFMERDYR